MIQTYHQFYLLVLQILVPSVAVVCRLLLVLTPVIVATLLMTATRRLQTNHHIREVDVGKDQVEQGQKKKQVVKEEVGAIRLIRPLLLSIVGVCRRHHLHRLGKEKGSQKMTMCVLFQDRDLEVPVKGVVGIPEAKEVQKREEMIHQLVQRSRYKVIRKWIL